MAVISTPKPWHWQSSMLTRRFLFIYLYLSTTFIKVTTQRHSQSGPGWKVLRSFRFTRLNNILSIIHFGYKEEREIILQSAIPRVTNHLPLSHWQRQGITMSEYSLKETLLLLLLLWPLYIAPPQGFQLIGVPSPTTRSSSPKTREGHIWANKKRVRQSDTWNPIQALWPAAEWQTLPYGSLQPRDINNNIRQYNWIEMIFP